MATRRAKTDEERQKENPSAALAVISTNLKALRAAHPNYDSDAKIGKKAGMDQKTVWRIIAMTNEPTTEQISKLAAVFDLEPWQLLVPSLEVTNPPMLEHQSKALRQLLTKIGSTKEALEGFLKSEGNTKPGDL